MSFKNKKLHKIIEMTYRKKDLKKILKNEKMHIWKLTVTCCQAGGVTMEPIKRK